MTSVFRTMAGAAALALVASPAYAQSLNTGATGTYGQVQLNNNFLPDPYTVTVVAGGTVESTRAGEQCIAGFIAARPSFTLRYSAGELPLFIGATSDADTTIAVRGPDGRWSCNDDSDGLNPMVSYDSPRSGRYQIWVGRFGVENDQAAASLYISEMGPVQTGVYGDEGAYGAYGATGGGPDFTREPAYGSVELVSGFTPDPHTVDIAAGGSLDASSLGGTCLGFIAEAPDFRVQWTAGSGDLPLIFSVASDSDTTLVINDAEGNWICDDDGGNEGLNPSVTFTAPVSGQYDVWVGTYTAGELQESQLNVSEVISR